MLRKFRLGGRSPRRSSTSDLVPVTTNASANSTSPALLRSPTDYVTAGKGGIDGPLGLTTVAECAEAVVDIVFVHGLGGASRRTWCRNRDISLFWPQQWLPRDLPTARIHSFGYNANFQSTRSTIYGIHDFAKQLLLALAYDAAGELGKRPIIFVAHSMGGLVVKKAYAMARLDPEYKELASQFYGCIFLATPYRGSAHAKMLQNLLSVSFSSVPTKPYLDDLAKNSTALQNINEEFRHMASELKIVSFYETLKTALPVGSAMIVERDSATLGYSVEAAAGLNGDHHTVCKFWSPEDPDYISVRNVLSKWVRECAKNAPSTRDKQYKAEMKKVQALLSMVPTESDEELLLASLDQRTPGTCEWIRQKPYFKEWSRSNAGGSQLLWLTGLPGSGKSVIASYIIDTLRQESGKCQYYLFRSSEKSQSTTQAFLRSLAMQLAASYDWVRQSLAALYDERDGLPLGNSEARTISQNVFRGRIFAERSADTFHWVIDAIDECPDYQMLIQFLGNLPSTVSTKVLIISRETESLAREFNHTRGRTMHHQITPDDTLIDIKKYVENEVQELPGDHAARRRIAQRVLEKASGCFLWVRLAIEEIKDVGHTQEGIQRALESVPAEMDRYYERALDSISKLHDVNQKLAKSILTWVISAMRPLGVEELGHALEAETGPVVDLGRLISKTCAHLLTIDQRGRVQPIHQTAREFLVNASRPRLGLEKRACHEHLAQACLNLLLKESLHGEISSRKPFLRYALAFWSDHVRLATADSDPLLDSLVGFLRTKIAAWIEQLASTGNLDIIIRTARNLKAYLERRAKLPTPTTVLRTGDSGLVDSWAVDLIRITTKFGKNLLDWPVSIHTIIPPLCPQRSITFRQLSSSKAPGFRVLGRPFADWSDCISRIQMHGKVSSLAVGDIYFAVGFDSGSVTVLDCSTCQVVHQLPHGEKVSKMDLNAVGDKLVTGGARHIKVWALSTGQVTNEFHVEHNLLSLAFSADGLEILGVNRANNAITWKLSENREVRRFHWQETDLPDRYRGFPMAVTVCVETNAMAVSHRGFPVSVWDLSSEELIGHVVRRTRTGRGNAVTQDTAFCFDFNRVTRHLVLAYSDGTLLKWHPNTGEQAECDTDAHLVRCSSDGLTIVTGDYFGNIKIWNFATLELIQHFFTNDDAVDQLAFSPNNLRFYDVRGTYCSVWEPESLVRATQQEDDGSSFGPIDSEFTEATVVTTPDIKTLVCHSKQPYASYAKDDGGVYLYSLAHGKEMQKLYSHAQGVAIIAHCWSPSAKYMATADASRRILLQRIVLPHPPPIEDTSWSVHCLVDWRSDRSIEETFFSNDGSKLFAVSSTDCHIWTTDGTLLHSIAFGEHHSGSWLACPHFPSEIFLIEDEQGYALNQANLGRDGSGISDGVVFRLVQKNEYLLPSHRPEDYRVGKVRMSSVDIGSWLCIEIAPKVYSPGNMYIMIASLETTASGRKTAAVELVLRQVERFVGIYNGSVVFLDKDLWVCSWSLREQPEFYDRHFFLPQDWISRKYLDGTFELSGQGDFVLSFEGGLFVIKDGFKHRYKGKRCR